METRSRKRNSIGNAEVKPKQSRRTAQTTKLTDLNEDVLVHVFEYLDTENMINVVKASKTFLKSSQRAFKRQFLNKYIELPLRDTNKAFERSTEIIRYFGENISKLELNYGILKGQRNKQMHDLVMKQCNETLIEIHFRGLSTNLTINKCFPKLKTLNISEGCVDSSLCALEKWFPSVENFEIVCVENLSPKLAIGRNIPSLKGFAMDFCLHSPSRFNIKQLNDFIKCNPQVKELSLTLDKHMFDTTKKEVDLIDDRDAKVYGEMMTLKVLMYSGTLAELAIPHDRIGHFELQSTKCETHKQICGFIANCINLSILKLEIKVCCVASRKIFEGVAWIDYAKRAHLTRLEICFEMKGRGRGLINPFDIGLVAIQPHLQHNELSIVKLSYESNLNESLMQNVNLRDVFATQINAIHPNRWSFMQENSSGRISLTMKKISAQK